MIYKEKYIFASLFLLANKLQQLGDKHLKPYGLTVKQWFLIVIISQFDNPPKLTEVAEKMGSSRQNTKQIAIKLEEKGFIQISKDIDDSRTLRMSLTEKNEQFWIGRDELDGKFISDIFTGLSENEIDIMYSSINKILNKLE